MISRTPACLSGVLGGLCWVARYVLDRVDVAAAGGQAGTALRWAGMTWLALALFAAGSGLASRAGIALRILVGLCVVVLGATTLSLLYPATGQLVAETAFGGVAAVVALIVFWRGASAGSEHHRGSHAAD